MKGTDPSATSKVPVKVDSGAIRVNIRHRHVGPEQAAAALCNTQGGGKSGLRRTGCWITSSPGDGKESATESKPP